MHTVYFALMPLNLYDHLLGRILKFWKREQTQNFLITNKTKKLLKRTILKTEWVFPE